MAKTFLKDIQEIEAARETMTQPSFTTGLFAGRPQFDLIMPFPEQSSQDKQIGDEYCKKVEAFLRAYVDPDEIERSAKIPERVFKYAFELGLFGMKIPKRYGGLGFSQTNYNRVLALVSSWCNIFGLTLSAHQSIGVSMPILLFGNEKQKQTYLPRVAQKDISAFALTEPSVGSDPASMVAQAVLNKEKTHYIVDGQKLWCTNAPIAGVILLMARVPAKKEKDENGKTIWTPVSEGNNADDNVITSFIVEMGTPGIKILQRCQFEGGRGIENAWIGFTNVRIPVENVIGRIGKGLKYALTILNTGRVSINPIVLGMTKQAWQPTLDWLNFRITFNKPLGKHETQTIRIAHMASNLFAMDAATWLASQMADNKTTDIRVEAALTKVFCSEAAIQFLEDSQILFGGRGYETADSKRVRGEMAFPSEQLVRDAKLYRIGEGATDVLTPFFSREAWDPHLREGKDFIAGKFKGIAKVHEALRLGNFYIPWYLNQWIIKNVEGDHPRVRKHLRYVERKSRHLARKVFYAMLWYGKKLYDRQAVVDRLAKTGIDLVMITATTLYAQHCEQKHNRIEAWDLADQFLRDAKKRIKGRGSMDGTIINDDRKTCTVGRKALKGYYHWLREGSLPRDYGPLRYPEYP
ncbi:acyl-CoA dehydrogenase family protein [Patescibacteria group bacterium AH-259-L05]|nr:acyl-CoA dehydrogenase family protein [Patescibacteria group bacterium AH-259-L05]